MNDDTKNQKAPEDRTQDPSRNDPDAARVKDRQKRTIGAQFPEHAQDTGEYPRQAKQD